MNRKTGLQLFLAFAVFFGCCMPLGGGAALYAVRPDIVHQYLPGLPALGSGNPLFSVTEGPMVVTTPTFGTPPVVDTPGGAPTNTPVAGVTPTITPSPTPTLLPVDQIRELTPHDSEFAANIQKANVIQGRNVLLANSGVNLLGFAEKTYTLQQNVPIPFPLNFVVGEKQVTVYDATFRVTTDVSLDEGVYLPAILQQVVVDPDLTKWEQVVLNPGTPDEEIVKMHPGTITLPYVVTCYSGFGIKPEGQRFEPAYNSRAEKLTENLVWNIKAVAQNDDVLTWALPRLRHTAWNSAMNAIMPYENGHRTTRILDQIHAGSKVSLTKSSGFGAVPSAYDLLLGYFNSQAPMFNISRITEIHFETIIRGDTYCASTEKIWDQELEAMLSAADIPANLLLTQEDLDAAP